MIRRDRPGVEDVFAITNVVHSHGVPTGMSQGGQSLLGSRPADQTSNVFYTPIEATKMPASLVELPTMAMDALLPFQSIEDRFASSSCAGTPS